jgi:hypothetical protein
MVAGTERSFGACHLSMKFNQTFDLTSLLYQYLTYLLDITNDFIPINIVAMGNVVVGW